MVIKFYSLLNDFTGLASAAFIALYPTVIHAINTDPTMAVIKNHALSGTLYTKLFSQVLIMYHDTGTATKNEMIIRTVNSFENSCNRLADR